MDTVPYSRTRTRSDALLARAEIVTPGGVNSPVRAFRSVGGKPLFLERGEGPYVFDVDGNRFLDFVGSWGPLILGHNNALVRNALLAAAEGGTSFGAPTEREVEFAELLSESIPSLEMLRFVSSGTEATMSAIRLARAFTGRDHLLKFNGCYHGHSDSLLVKAGSGVATFGIAGSAGVPEDLARKTVSIEFNDAELLERTLATVGAEKFAAVIVEPVPGNMGLVLPDPDYLRALQSLCEKHGILLIFDEVMCGFRVALGGAQERFGIKPDLSTFGKVIGGGLPVGAFGGRRDIMSQLAPLGAVYQAGTLSGNPLAMSAGLATIRYLREQNPYPQLESIGERFREGMRKISGELGIPLTADSCGSMIGFFFSGTPVRCFADASKSDIPRFNQFFWRMMNEGFYFAPSAYEAGFIGIQHTEALIDQTLAAARRVLPECKGSV